MSPRSVTLVLPGLTAAAGAPASDVPALKFLLKRGSTGLAPSPALVAVARRLGYDYGAASDIPAGSLAWLAAFGTPPGRPVMQAALVHLRADLDRLLLYAGAPLRITAEERDALVAAFNAHFVARGVTLHGDGGGRLWMMFDEPPAVRPVPLEEVLGRSLAAVMPAGEGGAEWSAFLNEVQMLFFDHPVNRARQQQGRPAINGLWCWGGAVPGAAGGSPAWDKVWTDAAVVRGMAAHAAVAHAALPAGPSALAEDGARRPLIWLEMLVEPAAWRDEDGWREALAEVESKWVAPLTGMLRRGRIGSLELMLDDGHLRRCGRWRARLGWRVRSAPIRA